VLPVVSTGGGEEWPRQYPASASSKHWLEVVIRFSHHKISASLSAGHVVKEISSSAQRTAVKVEGPESQEPRLIPVRFAKSGLSSRPFRFGHSGAR
jgi:hypothetical protein